MDQREQGRILRRGGRRVEVDKVDDAFTAQVKTSEEVERLEAQEGVASVEPVTPTTVRVRVAPDRRDQLMEQLRDDGMVVHHRYQRSGTPATRYDITDEIIVKFAPATSPERIAEILDEARVVVHKDYPHLENAYLVTVTDAAKANPLKVANRLAEHAEVEYAEPALVNRFRRQSFPTDEFFRDQWHLYSKDSVAPDIARDADAYVYEAWQVTEGRRDVVVALLDDGFDITHPDLQGPGKIVAPTDFVGGDVVPLPEGSDYHGTCCAGVAVAERNGIGCVGAAPGCALMPVRFPLSAPDPWLIEIFRYVSQRADVVSCSWGPPPGYYPLNSAFAQTLAELARNGGKDGRGLVICVAAGNYDAPLNATVDYTITWGRPTGGRVALASETGPILNGLAAHPDVVAVAACTSLNQKALYSNWGAEVSVAAPSNNFNPRTYGSRPGRGITTIDNEPYGKGFTAGKRYTNRFGGTSSATPLAAGIAALVKSANPSLTALDVKRILQQTADKITDTSADPFYGRRGGTYDANGRCDWFGYGKVNANRAVREAVRRLPSRRTVEAANGNRLDIPDASPVGIASAITITDAGIVERLEVHVELEHPFIGDLVVALASPDGTTVDLHRREGGSRHNLARTYASDAFSPLAALVGKQALGDWVLNVADRASRDVGHLVRWSLKIELREEARLHLRSPEAVVIPDDDPRGVDSRLSVDQDLHVRGLAVSVDVTHSWPDDVRVSIVAPSGREVVLHQAGTGERGDWIRETYSSERVPALATLVADGGPRGEWTLKVADLARNDVGKLNSWELDFTLA